MNIRNPKIINGETHILCSRCKQYKRLGEFGFDKRGKSVRRSWCKECSKEYSREYSKEHRKEYSKEYRKERVGENRKAANKFLRNNRELCRERNRQWRLNNTEKAKKACRNWYKRKKNKVTTCLGNRLYESLNSSFDRKKIWEILGYTYKEFVKHIEERFQPGMTWDNHGEWEFDHIIPIAFFHFESPKDVEFKMCWRLENIQPLWKHQNRQKNSKVLIA